MFRLYRDIYGTEHGHCVLMTVESIGVALSSDRLCLKLGQDMWLENDDCRMVQGEQ